MDKMACEAPTSGQAMYYEGNAGQGQQQLHGTACQAYRAPFSAYCRSGAAISHGTVLIYRHADGLAARRTPKLSDKTGR